MNNIGPKIKDLRTAKGISLRKLAEEVGIHFGFLSKVENGKESCGAETLTRLAEVLNVDADLLLGEAGHRSLPYRVLGNIAAGTPIEATEHIETFDLCEHFAPVNHYMLKVRGDSMIREGINDGDLAIIRHGNSANNGQIVVAIVGEEEATLKTYSRKGRKITLTPANRRLRPKSYAVSEVQIRGTLVGVVRTSISTPRND